MRAASGVRLTREPDPLPATLANMNADATQPAAILLRPDGPDAAMRQPLQSFSDLHGLATAEPPGAAAGANRPPAPNDELRNRPVTVEPIASARPDRVDRCAPQALRTLIGSARPADGAAPADEPAGDAGSAPSVGRTAGLAPVQPLVSCIMPTSDRRAFVPMAIRYFARQDYEERELIIVDDGADPVEDLVPADPRIRYLRLPRKVSVGAKRNLACESARGSLVAHWDDDDWHAPWRLSYQITSLLTQQADLCGLDTLWFFDPLRNHGWQFRYKSAARRWLAGGSFCYRRALWERHRFADIFDGEDTRFVAGLRGARILQLERADFYVARIHAGNTNPKRPGSTYWQSAPAETIRALLGEDFAAFMACREEPAPAIPDAKPPIARAQRREEVQVKLNLGCADALIEGFVNVDIAPHPGVQQVDLRKAWPWADSSIDYVRAWDIIEHLPDKVFTMNEIWRVLRPECTVEIAVPTTDGSGAFQDPTHVSFWNRRSFLYYEAGNPYRERFAASYGVQASFRVVFERIDQTQDGPRLLILMTAVKP